MNISRVTKFINPGTIITKLNAETITPIILTAILGFLIQITTDLRESIAQNAYRIEMIQETTCTNSEYEAYVKYRDKQLEALNERLNILDKQFETLNKGLTIFDRQLSLLINNYNIPKRSEIPFLLEQCD